MAEEKKNPDLLQLSADDLDRVVQERIRLMIASGTIPSAAANGPAQSLGKGTMRRGLLNYGREATADYIVGDVHNSAEGWRSVEETFRGMPPAQRPKYIAGLRRAYGQIREARLRNALMVKLARLAAAGK